MRADTKSGNSPRRRLIAVDWQDCAWQPRIVVRPRRRRWTFVLHAGISFFQNP